MRFLLVSGAATALVATSTVMNAAEPARNRDQLVCKTEAKTGSRFGRRSCISRQERERMAIEQQQQAAELRDRPQGFDCRASGAANPDQGQNPQGC